MSDSTAKNNSTTSEKRLDNPCVTTNVGRLHKRLTLNAFSNLLRHFFAIIVAFFLTPFVVKTLGDEFYGFWTVLLSLVGYAGILEFGVQPGIVKLVAQYRAFGNMGQINRLLSTAFLFFISVGTLASIVFVIVLTLFCETLIRNMPPIGHQGLLFTVIAIDVVLSFLMYVFTGILYGWQRYHAKNVISIAILITNATLLVTFLQPGALLTLAVIKTTVDFLALVITVLVCWKVVPGLKLDMRLVTKRSFTELFSFAGKLFISATTTRLATLAYPIILGLWLSMAAVTFFAISNRLVGYAKGIGWTMTASFMPAFSELASKNESSLLRDIYTRYSRYMLFITSPILVFMFVIGPAFINLWMGPSYAEAGQVTLYLLTAAAAVDAFQPLIWRFFIGVGKLNELILIAAVNSTICIVLSIFLVQQMGIAGVALSILVGALIGQAIMTPYACQYFDIRFWTFISRIHLRPMAAGIFLFGAAEALVGLIGVNTYTELTVVVLFGGVLYMAFVFAFGMDHRESRWAMQKVKNVLAKGRSRYY